MRMKRKMADSLCIHHVNGNHNDNRPKNQLVLTYREHAKLHILQGDYPQTFKIGNRMGSKLRKTPPNSQLSWCSGCQKFLSKVNFRKDKNAWNGLDRFCKKCRKPYDKKHNRK